MIVPLSSLADNDDWLDNAREDWAAMNLTPLSQDVSQCIMSKYVHFQLSPIHPFSKLFELFILFFVHLRNFLMFVVVS